MAPSVPDESVDLGDYPSASSPNTGHTDTTATCASPRPESFRNSDMSQPPNIPSNALEIFTTSSPSVTGSTTNQQAASPPAQSYRSWAKRVAKFVWSRLEISDRSISISALFLAAVVAYPAFKQWDIARWEARKDFLLYCCENIDHLKVEERQPCEAAIAKGLAPPTNFAVRLIKRVMPAAWIAGNGETQTPSFTYDIISRGLHAQLLAPTNLTIKSHTQVPPTSNLQLATAIIVAIVWSDPVLEQEVGALWCIPLLRGLSLWFGLVIGTVCASKFFLWSYDKALRAQISSLKEYLAYCEGLNRSEKDYQECQNTLQIAEEQTAWKEKEDILMFGLCLSYLIICAIVFALRSCLKHRNRRLIGYNIVSADETRTELQTGQNEDAPSDMTR